MLKAPRDSALCSLVLFRGWLAGPITIGTVHVSSFSPPPPPPPPSPHFPPSTLRPAPHVCLPLADVLCTLVGGGGGGLLLVTVYCESQSFVRQSVCLSVCLSVSRYCPLCLVQIRSFGVWKQYTVWVGTVLHARACVCVCIYVVCLCVHQCVCTRIRVLKMLVNMNEWESFF